MNRFFLKPWWPQGFFDSYLNDLLFVPFWVPIMLFGLRSLGLRESSGPPGATELMIPVIMISWVFEILLPHSYLGPWVVADPYDILCYSAGGLAAAVFWNGWYGRRFTSTLSRPPT